MSRLTPTEVEFCTYCIGNVAAATQLNQTDVYSRLKKSGILADYIIGYFDIAHTFSKSYIVEDIIALMKKRGVYES